MPISNWSSFIEQHLFSDDGGSFALPYLSNNPYLMVESVKAMSVSDHRKEEQGIYTNTAFTEGVMRYRKIEDGLWLISSELAIKQNIISRALYQKDILSDYYFLSFAVFEYKFPTDISGKELATLISTTCTFYKPGTEVSTFFYENTKGRFFNLAFTKNWAEKNIKFSADADKNEVLQFLNGETGFMNWLDIVPNAKELSNTLWNHIAKEKNGKFNTRFLKPILVETITDFFKKAIAGHRLKNYQPLNNSDYANVAAAEKLILNNLTAPFLGVEHIARAVHVSPTKLKLLFKIVFDFSLLQYQKEKNMLLAMQLIKKSTMQIKNIAALTGYTSSSKFSATFKKRFGMLPTEIRNN